MHRNPPLSRNICSSVTNIDLLLSKSNNLKFFLLAYTIWWCMLDQKWTKKAINGNFKGIHCSVVVVQKLEMHCTMTTNQDNKRGHWTSPRFPPQSLLCHKWGSRWSRFTEAMEETLHCTSISASGQEITAPVYEVVPPSIAFPGHCTEPVNTVKKESKQEK